VHAVIADPVTHFIAQVVAIVALSRLLGLGARRLGQPLVIAEIVAGILLGPSFFGWLWPDVAGALFSPESLGVVGTVSQVGLVLFMFLIGLELDPRLLRGRERASVAISYATTAAPFALGAGLAIYLHDGFADPAVSLVTFALFMGAFMSVTAFPVLARILVERRLLRSRVGAVTIACAAAADLTAWCVLAFVVAAARAHGQLDALVTTALALAYVAAMLVLVRPVLVRLAARVSGPDGMSQNVAAAVLVLALMSSGLTQLMGIHAVFGAFLFGAVLPRQGGFARALAEKLEDLVIIVLVPLFFAYSGVRTEIGLLDSAGDWAVCGLILLVGTVGKAGGGALAARLSGLSWRESGALGVLMNTRGLMGIIVLNIGLDLGVISAELFSMMILMALVTTVVATPLVQRLYPAELMARDLVDALERKGGEALRAGEERVLVCVSDAGAAAPMVNLAAGLARAGDAARLYALHLVPAGEWPAVQVDDADQELPAPLAAAAATAEERGVELETLSFVSPDPADDIARVAAVRGADLVLLGSSHPKDALGSAARAVLRQTSATVAVLIEAAPLSVLVACRGAADDRAALALAGRLVGPDGSVEVVEPATMAHAMSERVSLLLARGADRPRTGRL
jgi:Kef-type K+ transport system membrane component KefB/nucleotide-binding universal stress UspA family protein